MKSISKAAQKELLQIQKKKGGMLNPEDIVKFAEDEDTALHKFFEWDNDEAAVKYRLLQARAIIRVVVQIIPDTGEKIRTFISLSTDRKENGGYRIMTDVIEDEALSDIMLEDARRDLEIFRAKYLRLKHIKELGHLFVIIDEVIAAPAKESLQVTKQARQ